jgi:uncharacterized protein YgbK (DUF1537 family)
LDNKRISKSQLLNNLPDEWPQNLRPAINKHIKADLRKIVVLDDDPTGTQTIHGLPVLTEWSTETLAAELNNDLSAFYILTNSRSYTLPVARKINAEIGYNLASAAEQTRHKFTVISRSDSTLRGHFPGEVEALSDALAQNYDGWIIIPFFLEGCRYTVDNIHYVEEDGILVPAAETEFAQDRVFGYSKSNLCDWMAEKANGHIAAKDVRSISIEDLRKGGPESVTTILMGLHDGKYSVVNAASYRDLEVFVQGLLAAEARGKTFIFRTAASFVQVRTGISPRPLLTQSDLQLSPDGGGLIVVGSYVPRSTKQINSLLTAKDVSHTEISVDALVDDRFRDSEIDRVVNDIEKVLRQGKDMLVFTGRRLMTGKDSKSSLQIGQKISQGLIVILRGIQTAPRYILAKGGITSSDIATRALNVKKAFVLGQIQPGVPVWRLGNESRFPDLAYIVFPGNVGDENALVTIVHQLKLGKDV